MEREDFERDRADLSRARGALNVFGLVLPRQARDAIGTLVEVVERLVDRVEVIEARTRRKD